MRYRTSIRQNGRLWSWTVTGPLPAQDDDAAHQVLAHGLVHTEDRAQRRAASAVQRAESARGKWLAKEAGR